MSFVKFHLLLIIFFFSIGCSLCHSQIINGVVLNDKSEPIQYANIGIEGKAIGTVSDINGQFELNISNAKKTDVFRVSCIGFKAYFIPVKDMSGSPLTIKLDEDIVELNQVIVQTESKKERKIGSKKAWGIMNTGWRKGYFGGERGVKITFSKNSKNYLTSINYHIDINEYDSVLFRLRIRSLNNNKPGEDLLTESIYLKTQIENGWQKHDLSDRNLVYDGGSYSLSLEFIEAWGECSQNQCLHISMNMASGIFFLKETSFDSWVVKKLRSPTIYLTYLRLD